jgi:hypothetical protein
MSQCPVCLSDVPDEFGLIECHNCGAQLLVHMDGRVEHSSGDPGASSAPQSMEEFLTEQAVEPENEFMAEEIAEDHGDVAPESVDQPEYVDPSDSAEPTEYKEPTEPAAEPNLDFLNEPAAESYSAPSASGSPDLSDVAHFGNSDQSGTREGVLRYNLRINGIDTSDIRDAFREALTDRKFMWDTDSILRSIRQGQVVIPNITASKAFMLVNRLRSLPVDIEWEQYAVTQN